MKKSKISVLILSLLVILFTSSCSLKTDHLEDATIYTTVYPINYLTKYLYGDYGKISSIYPLDANLDKYKLTKKQIRNYASGDLFIYNGLTKEKDIAKTLINKNKDLLIIDVSYGLSLNNDPIELWLSPNNYLMLAKNIRNNLTEYVESKIISEAIDVKYNEFSEKISLLDARLHNIGKNASDSGKNTVIVSNNGFKYLENYGFKVISMQDESNLKERKLNTIKQRFDDGKYKYILVADSDADNKTIKDLIDNHSAKSIKVDTMTLSLTEDYFDIMIDYIESINSAAC